MHLAPRAASPRRQRSDERGNQHDLGRWLGDARTNERTEVPIFALGMIRPQDVPVEPIGHAIEIQVAMHDLRFRVGMPRRSPSPDERRDVVGFDRPGAVPRNHAVQIDVSGNAEDRRRGKPQDPPVRVRGRGELRVVSDQ
jgi:hypothetical protein